MLIGLPIAIMMLLVTWIWLTRFGFKLDTKENPETKQLFRQCWVFLAIAFQLNELGKMSQGEKTVAAGL